ncbi:hypothetical protein QNH39_00040 [Neobacillus novalis]|uniref:Uncharacterized protein n=1 Tax=Neobacillus novalis TaxID=220687 RepID=A0AA95MQT3_9BACI|nr:hypothetical protein [Neobacillus novalis]WHY86363.1 hypothetical protein QNH39_00040 [Neobacillus novalis]
MFLFLLAVLKNIVDFDHNVDWTWIQRDSCGISGTGETPQAL